MPLLQIGMSEIPKDYAGLGSGIVNVSQQMAAAVGLAILSSIATTRTHSLLADGQTAIHSLTAGYQLALVLAAGSVLLGLALAPILLRTRETPEEERRHIAENMQNPEAMEHLVLEATVAPRRRRFSPVRPRSRGILPRPVEPRAQRRRRPDVVLVVLDEPLLRRAHGQPARPPPRSPART